MGTRIMINVRSFILGYYPIRGFLAWREGDTEALFVDPGGWDEAIPALLAGLGLRVTAIALTHGHPDHTGGLEEMVDRLRAPVYAHDRERQLPREPDQALAGGETIAVGSAGWRALPVPGHTPGCLAYAAGDAVFTGDALFAGSIGGTASLEAYEEERRAIREQLWPLGDATRVFPAHGPATTIGIERRSNPFLR